MKNPLQRTQSVKDGIGRAEAYAEEKKLPLMIERLAWGLGISVKTLRQIYEGSDEEELPKEARRAIQNAYTHALACLAEQGMGKSASMATFLLKNHGGYREKAEESIETGGIIFVGEEKL